MDVRGCAEGGWWAEGGAQGPSWVEKAVCGGAKEASRRQVGAWCVPAGWMGGGKSLGVHGQAPGVLRRDLRRIPRRNCVKPKRA